MNIAQGKLYSTHKFQGLRKLSFKFEDIAVLLRKSYNTWKIGLCVNNINNHIFIGGPKRIHLKI